MTDNVLPNCRECGHNHDVTIVEGLADTYDGVLYRVCCSSCGGDWTWEMKLIDPNARLFDAQYSRYLKHRFKTPLPMSYEEWLEWRLETHIEGILELQTAMTHNEEQASLDKRWGTLVRKAKTDSNYAAQPVDENGEIVVTE